MIFNYFRFMTYIMNVLDRMTQDEERAVAEYAKSKRMSEGRKNILLSEMRDIVNMAFYEAAIEAGIHGIDTEDDRFMDFYRKRRSEHVKVEEVAYLMGKGKKPKMPRQKDLYG